jgi:2-polyprenyl-3-methyl-5-hydroxy-6-metoxy-1,4-benzoquinol methylase
MLRENFTQTQINAISKYKQLIEDGKISFWERDCLCGHSDFNLISKIDRHSLPQRVVLCKKCGLMFSNPSLTEESFQYFYSTDLYRNLYEESDYIEKANKLLNNEHCKYLYDDLSPLLNGNKNLNILEFGCGGGWNLIHFFKAGYDVVGYDLSPKLTQVGRSFGLDLREGTISDIEGEYDIIIMNHVIEHFTDLLCSMQSVIKHLKPGGLVYIGVPNIDNYGLGQLQNAHVYYFTPQTFKFYMSRCSLRLIKFGSAQEFHMYGIFELEDQCSDISVLKPEPKRLMKIIRRARLKEILGMVFGKLGLKNLIKSGLKKLSVRN